MSGVKGYNVYVSYGNNKKYKKVSYLGKKKTGISLVKVTGHSGDKYNDEADRLAKKALGL